MSQIPNTKDYIIVFENGYHYKQYEKCGKCEKCEKEYIDESFEWCESCKISYLKDNFTNWTSGNEHINKFIQERQLEVNHYDDIIFEWIPYNQFNDIKEMSRDKSAIICLAVWKDGPLT